MCFTISIHTNRLAIEKRFRADASSLQDFGFNYFYRAFDDPVIPVICSSDKKNVVPMKWGLIPYWAEDAEQAMAIKKGTYNARGESLTKKPSFKKAFEDSRCLVIASGFFEWQHVGNEKIPWYIHLKQQPVFAFAGICDRWTDPSNGLTSTGFSIVTTKANSLMEKIHNKGKRMPLILEPGSEMDWLNGRTPLEDVLQIISPFDESRMSAYTIGKKISKTQIDPSDASLIEHVDYYVNNKLF